MPTPVVTCHTLKLQSRELDTTIAESGEKDSPVMSSPCPCKALRNFQESPLKHTKLTAPGLPKCRL